jgi:hypothetical protein
VILLREIFMHSLKIAHHVSPKAAVLCLAPMNGSIVFKWEYCSLIVAVEAEFKKRVRGYFGSFQALNRQPTGAPCERLQSNPEGSASCSGSRQRPCHGRLPAQYGKPRVTFTPCPTPVLHGE